MKVHTQIARVSPLERRVCWLGTVFAGLALCGPVYSFEADIYVKNSQDVCLGGVAIVDAKTGRNLAETAYDFLHLTYVAHVKGLYIGQEISVAKEGYLPKSYLIDKENPFYYFYLKDITPPEIYNLSTWPLQPAAGVSLRIDAGISDFEDGVQMAEVIYAPANEKTFYKKEMSAYGFNGWSAEINPDHVKEGALRWRIFAKDKAGNFTYTALVETKVQRRSVLINLLIQNSRGGSVQADVTYVAPDGSREVWEKKCFLSIEVDVSGHLLVEAPGYESVDQECSASWLELKEYELSVPKWKTIFLKRKNGPLIHNLSMSPAFRLNSLTISADVEDPVGIKWVGLHYWFSWDARVRTITMSAPLFSSRYQAEIPGDKILEEEGIIKFYIGAVNNDDKESYEPLNASSGGFHQIELDKKMEFLDKLEKKYGYNRLDILPVSDLQTTSMGYQFDGDGKVLVTVQIVDSRKPTVVWFITPGGTEVQPVLCYHVGSDGRQRDWYQGHSLTQIGSLKEYQDFTVQASQNAIAGCLGGAAAAVVVSAGAMAVPSCVVGAGVGFLGTAVDLSWNVIKGNLDKYEVHIIGINEPENEDTSRPRLYYFLLKAPGSLFGRDWHAVAFKSDVSLAGLYNVELPEGFNVFALPPLGVSEELARRGYTFGKAASGMQIGPFDLRYTGNKRFNFLVMLPTPSKLNAWFNNQTMEWEREAKIEWRWGQGSFENPLLFQVQKKGNNLVVTIQKEYLELFAETTEAYVDVAKSFVAALVLDIDPNVAQANWNEKVQNAISARVFKNNSLMGQLTEFVVLEMPISILLESFKTGDLVEGSFKGSVGLAYNKALQEGIKRVGRLETWTDVAFKNVGFKKYASRALKGFLAQAVASVVVSVIWDGIWNFLSESEGMVFVIFNARDPGPVEASFSVVGQGETAKGKSTGVFMAELPSLLPRQELSLTIIKPNKREVALVGPYDYPKRPVLCQFRLSGIRSPQITADSLKVYVTPAGQASGSGNTEASWTLGKVTPFSQTETEVLLTITAPAQSQAGFYDLQVEYWNGGQLIVKGVSEKSIRYENPGSGNVSVALVIDASGSMKWNDPGRRRVQAAQLFIDQLQPRDEVAVVDFGWQANVLAPLTSISEEDNSRESLKAAVGRVGQGGGTNYEAALKEALRSLRGASNPLRAVVFLTDGGENVGDSTDVVGQLGSEGWPVYTLGMMMDPDSLDTDEFKLRSIAGRTNGEFYRAPSDADLTVLYQKLAGVVSGQSTLLAQRCRLGLQEAQEASVVVDPTQSLVTFQVTQLFQSSAISQSRQANGSFHLVVLQPDGQPLDPQASGVRHVKTDFYEFYTVQAPQSGVWRMRVEAVQSSGGEMEVLVAATAETSLKGFLFPHKPSYARGEPVRLTLSLTDGLQPLTGANVTVFVTKPEGLSQTRSRPAVPTDRNEFGSRAEMDLEETWVHLQHRLNRRMRSFDAQFPLFDDGQHGDGAANDGVYSHLFTETETEGMYRFDLVAEGQTPEGAPFQRQFEDSVDVREQPLVLVADPAELKLGETYKGGLAQACFTVKALTDTAVSLSAQDLSSDSGKTVPAAQLHFDPHRFHLAGGASQEVKAVLEAPQEVTGKFQGTVKIESAGQTLGLPIEVTITNDRQSPSVELLEPARLGLWVGGPEPKEVKLKINEQESGTNYTLMKALLDGQEEVPLRYDPAASVASVDLMGKWNGAHRLRVWVEDIAGNGSTQDFAFGLVAPPPASGLRLVTLPAEFRGTSLSEVVPANGTVKVAWWSPSARQYLYDASQIPAPGPGRAFWLRGDLPKLLQSAPVPSVQEQVIPLRAGWNLIGNPSLNPIPWTLDGLRVRCQGVEKALKEAGQAGWLEPYAWGWEQDPNDPNTGRYVILYDENVIPGVKSQLAPWEGYWVKTNVDCELILSPPTDREIRDRKRDGKTDGWSLRLQASAAEGTAEAVLGMSRAQALAIGLPPEPPAESSPMQLFFLRDKQSLAVDVRPGMKQKQVWELVVKAETPFRHPPSAIHHPEKVTLTWPDLRTVPGDVALTLVDLTTGERRSLRTTTHYTYRPGLGETGRRFQIVAEQGPGQPLQIMDLRAVPTKGGGIQVQFHLTRPAVTTVMARALNGQAVATLERGHSRSPGANGVIWDVRDAQGRPLPRGVYLLEVQAEDEEGHRAQALRTVAVR